MNSFIFARSAHICLDQSTTKPLPIISRLPQGTLISLYEEVHLKIPSGWFGCVDDVAFIASARTLEVFLSELQRNLEISNAWAKENDIISDTKCKTELKHTQKKGKYLDLPLEVDQTCILVKEVIWLPGMLIDRKFSFKYHIRPACKRARMVTDNVGQICNTLRGSSQDLGRKAVQGYASMYLF